MKRGSIIFVTFFFIVCSYSKSSGQEAINASDFKKLDWMAGTWKRTNTKGSESGYEKWAKLSDSTWQGLGITLNGKDTSTVEKMTITIKKKGIYYIADVSGNPEPVWYLFSELTDNGFTCENTEYDFPKKIQYRKEGNKIKATISGNGKLIDYNFKKTSR